MSNGPLARALERAQALIDRVETMLPAPPQEPDWTAAIAFRWRRRGERRSLEPVLHPHRIRLSDLQAIDAQKKLVERNTRQFVHGHPANNVLLTGARGTGKSSLVKALLHKYAPRGLRLIEVGRHELEDLPEIVDRVYGRPERFIVFCDDLSFAADDPGYVSLKVALDGSIAGGSDNLLIYATSNRRHLMPEFMQENLQTRRVGDEIHPGEAVEEKVSLSDRFGLWISFHPFDQDAYLAAVVHWLAEMGVTATEDAKLRAEALEWALARGSRSGRSAWQFARDWAGRSRDRGR